MEILVNSTCTHKNKYVHPTRARGLSIPLNSSLARINSDSDRQIKSKVNNLQQSIFGFSNMTKVDPESIVFTRGFSLKIIPYCGQTNPCWAIDRKRHSYELIDGNDHVYGCHVHDQQTEIIMHLLLLLHFESTSMLASLRITFITKRIMHVI